MTENYKNTDASEDAVLEAGASAPMTPEEEAAAKEAAAKKAAAEAAALGRSAAMSRARTSGILVHPTSFPSPYGIGDLGQGAYDFIDFLAGAGQHLWQVLPLGPTGFGDSPYQCFSAFAGQPYIISPERLLKEGLLDEADLYPMPQWDPKRVDYGSAIQYKVRLLRSAFGHFRERADEKLLGQFAAFCEKEKEWLEDYCFFMAAKDSQGGRCWLEWPEELKKPDAKTRAVWNWKLEKDMALYRFIQFEFSRQWEALRAYAHTKEIAIIGDIPIFMALDSADVWGSQELFCLDTKGYPLEVAGVPPDYFCATGQLWGNPLYDWDAHEKTGYAWWIRRLRRQLEMVDYVRIDHFRGFESYWAVPAGEETAMNGTWKPGPRGRLFRALQAEFGKDTPIFAEDLGIITPEVEALRDEFGFPGMKVLQFGFGDMGDHQYIPHFYTTTNCICYTGTHDNDTTVGWYQSQSEEVRDRIRRLGNCDGSAVSLDFIRFVLGSIAKYAIFPIQDLLQLGNEARMNMPGVGTANWVFRYEAWQLEDWRRDWLMRLTRACGR